MQYDIGQVADAVCMDGARREPMELAVVVISGRGGAVASIGSMGYCMSTNEHHFLLAYQVPRDGNVSSIQQLMERQDSARVFGARGIRCEYRLFGSSFSGQQ